ncbi:MAG: hypothetical protein AAF735_06325 [Myxococcota bacterium]
MSDKIHIKTKLEAKNFAEQGWVAETQEGTLTLIRQNDESSVGCSQTITLQGEDSTDSSPNHFYCSTDATWDISIGAPGVQTITGSVYLKGGQTIEFSYDYDKDFPTAAQINYYYQIDSDSKVLLGFCMYGTYSSNN